MEFLDFDDEDEHHPRDPFLATYDGCGFDAYPIYRLYLLYRIYPSETLYVIVLLGLIGSLDASRQYYGLYNDISSDGRSAIFTVYRTSIYLRLRCLCLVCVDLCLVVDVFVLGSKRISQVEIYGWS